MKKICNCCGKNLPIEEFYNNPELRAGVIDICKRCEYLKKQPQKEYPLEFTCRICNKVKPYYEFDVTRKVLRKWYCKECAKIFAEENPGVDLDKQRRLYDTSYRERKREINRNSRINHYEHKMWANAKKHAPERGLEFNIDESDIVIPDKCPIFQKPFEFGKDFYYDWTPSLDRIDNTKEYIKGNVWVISHKANVMKNSATWDEIKVFCQNILRYSPNNNEKKVIELKDKEL